MKSMGHRYEEARLLRFDRFLQSRPDLSGESLNILIRAWSRSGSCPSHIVEAQRVGRTLAKILRRLDPSAKPFASDRRAEQLAHRAYRRPYIYTEDEIRCLLKVARGFPSPKAPLRSPTLYTMLVLATTGPERTYCKATPDATTRHGAGRGDISGGWLAPSL